METNLRIKNYGSYWEVVDNTGTKHRFGYNSDSQIPAIGRNAIRLWAIDQTLDLNGNSVEYTYVVDSTDGGYYPYAILYTRGNGLSADRKVQFEWEPRSDTIYDYASGSVVKLGYRLHRIATYTGVTAIRNYIFSYVQSPYSARSLLQTVTMYNADQTASLRLAAMGYQQGENAFGTSTVWTGMGAGNVGDPFYFADFNGDGRTDIASVLAGVGMRVELSTGASFSGTSVWTTSGGGNIGRPYYLGDFNGDGKIDLGEIRSGIGFVIRLSDGTKFDAPGSGTWFSGSIGGDQGEPVYIGDFNAGSGSGTWSPIGTGNIGAAFYLADFNGDGKTDIANCMSGQGFRVALSTGSSFGTTTVWNPTGGGNQGESFYIGDFNGDGKADIGEGRLGTGVVVRASTPMVKSDLLASLTNKEGGITSFGYQPSTQFSNTRLPFPMHILTAVTQNDGLNHVYKTNLIYSGGLYDLRKREFRGFNQVKTVEPDGSSTVTLFHQDEIFVGRSYREDRYNASGALAARRPTRGAIRLPLIPPM